MADGAGISTAVSLQDFHARLDEHFAELHAARQSLQAVSPVFALEHGLSHNELQELTKVVRIAVVGGLSARARLSWLPFVVYATESGYDYVGDEYWKTFEKATPGWRNEHRAWIKTRFTKFAMEYGGAVPTGAFADTFSIIAWPITHAVLPTYLQRQLAQLLFEFSSALTSALLDDPATLGSRLASRTAGYSERFRIFCSNTTLVGQVAAALLSGEDEPTPYLLGPTLHRIVQGLSQEQQARRWLLSAQRSASRVRGFKPTAGAGNHSSSEAQVRIRDARLFLRREARWTAHVELPDLSSLISSFPEAYQVLRRSRVLVNGGARAVSPSGLLYPGQEMQLASWPQPGQPLLRLERGEPAANALLTERCSISRGPWWLFQRQPAGRTVEVKGKFVRPGRDYVLVGHSALLPPVVPWCSLAEIGFDGAMAYELSVPDQIKDTEESALKACGLAVVSHVAIRPVGVVAAAWDGEGEAEWRAGETAMLGIYSDLSPKHCRLVMDGSTYLLDWDSGSSELFFGLEALPVGAHELVTTLLGEGDRELATGSLSIIVRDPLVRPEGAALGEGIRMLASPASPSLSELWDERAYVSIDGPLGTVADLEVSLLNDSGQRLAKVRRSIRFPVDEEAWNATARTIRKDPQFTASYDEAESCTLNVARDGIGHATLRCERGFQPLRWRFARSKGRMIATLVDRTDGGQTSIDFYEVERPLKALSLPPLESFHAPARGGLAIARAGKATAAVILPTSPNELFGLPPLAPEVTAHQKTSREILRLAEGHARWMDAELPADAFAALQQQAVGDAFAGSIGMLIGGNTWAALERRLVDVSEPADLLEDMQIAVGVSPDHRSLGKDVAYSLYGWLSAGSLLMGFDQTIQGQLRKSGLGGKPTAARFLLMLAGRPGFITKQWEATECTQLLDAILQSPVLYRAARFAVLGTRALNDADGVARSF